MPERLKPAILMFLGALTLGACHTDPFSIKPEVNVTLPEKPPADAAQPEKADETESGGSEGTNTP